MLSLILQGREGEREVETSARETPVGCVLLASKWGPAGTPGPCPDQKLVGAARTLIPLSHTGLKDAADGLRVQAVM